MRKTNIAGYPSMAEYPKWMYHATEPPRSIKSEKEEETLLKAGWSAEYIKKRYPKYVEGKGVVASPEEEAKPAPPAPKKPDEDNAKKK